MFSREYFFGYRPVTFAKEALVNVSYLTPSDDKESSYLLNLIIEITDYIMFDFYFW